MFVHHDVPLLDFPCALLGWILILRVAIEVKLCHNLSLQVTCAILFH
jgi:hypothetical protein